MSGECKSLVTELLQHLLLSKKQNGYSGSDLRVALIEVNNLIQCQDVDEEIHLLLSTAVKISERLYSSCDKRTPTVRLKTKFPFRIRRAITYKSITKMNKSVKSRRSEDGI